MYVSTSATYPTELPILLTVDLLIVQFPTAELITAEHSDVILRVYGMAKKSFVSFRSPALYVSQKTMLLPLVTKQIPPEYKAQLSKPDQSRTC